MASRLDLVYENFIWRIEAITPTATRGNFGPFRYLDTPHVGPEEAAPGRRFQVICLGSAEEHQTDEDALHTAGSNRVADHEFGVTVYYPAELNHRTLHSTVLQDRHDLIAQLGLGSTFVGYSDANSATDIGLWRRYRVAGGLTIDAGLLALEQVWSCSVYETE